jgi:hypothetical protein
LKLNVELIHDLVVKVHVLVGVPPRFLVGPHGGSHLGHEIPECLWVVVIRGSQLVEFLVDLREKSLRVQVGLVQCADCCLHGSFIVCPEMSDLLLG